MEGEDELMDLKEQLMNSQERVFQLEREAKASQIKFNLEIKRLVNSENRAATQLKEANARCENFKNEAETLRKQNQLHKEKVAKLKSERTALREQIAKAAAQYKTLRDQLKSLERVLPSQQFLEHIRESVATAEPYEQLFEKKMLLIDEVCAKTEENEELRRRVEDEQQQREQAVALSKQRLEECTRLINENQARFHAVEKAAQASREQAKTLQAELSKVKTQLQKSVGEAGRLGAQLREAHQAQREQEEKHDQQRQKLLEVMSQSSQNEAESHRRQLEEVIAQYGERERRLLLNIEQAEEEHQATQERVRAIEEQSEEYRLRAARSAEERNVLSQQLATVCREKEAQFKAISQLQADIAASNAEAAQYKIQLEADKAAALAECASLLQQKNELEQKLKLLQTELVQTRKTLEEAKSKEDSLLERLSKKESALNQLSSDLQRKAECQATSQDEQHLLQQNNLSLKAKVQDLTHLMEEGKEEVARLKQRVSAFQQEVSSAKEELLKQRTRREQLQSELQQQIQTLSKKVQSLTVESDRLRQVMASKEAGQQKQLDALQEAMAKLREQNTTLAEENAALKERVSLLSSQLQKEAESAKAAVKQLQTARAETLSLQEQGAVTKLKLQSQAKSLRQQLQLIGLTLASKEKAYQELSVRLEGLRQDQQAGAQRIRQLESRADTAQAVVSTQVCQVTDAQSQTQQPEQKQEKQESQPQRAEAVPEPEQIREREVYKKFEGSNEPRRILKSNPSFSIFVSLEKTMTGCVSESELTTVSNEDIAPPEQESAEVLDLKAQVAALQEAVRKEQSLQAEKEDYFLRELDYFSKELVGAKMRVAQEAVQKEQLRVQLIRVRRLLKSKGEVI